jgi:hydrogenase maturation factor
VTDDLAIASLALARRFATGATLWCWSPAWPHHAQHVAVEFVHPVIMGKRALPAAAVEGAAAVGALRTLSAPGDGLVALADATDAAVADVMHRARAWGVTTFWLGCGTRPPAGAADHVLWLDGAGVDAVHDGRVVQLYHVLWELTHVCFEHPGLLDQRDAACDDGVCITCSDEGRLAEVIEATAAGGATVRTAAGVEEVDVTLVGAVQRDDLLLVHAGMALDRVGAAPR